MLYSKINGIVKNLMDNTPVSYASYSIIEDDETIFQFMTDDKWSSYYSKNQLFKMCPLSQATFRTKDNSILYLPWNKVQASSKVSRDILLARRHFNQNYGITIVNSYKDGVKEAFVFSSAQEIDFLKIMKESTLIQKNIKQVSLAIN